MSLIEKSIEINVPVRAAYNQWTQFEEFPKFMEGVKHVKQLDDKHLDPVGLARHGAAVRGGAGVLLAEGAFGQEPPARRKSGIGRVSLSASSTEKGPIAVRRSSRQ